jgi:predicted HAD superfamily Cof-like phosphohydrolase
MKQYVNMVGEFHQVFDQKDATKPTLVPKNLGKLRYSLLLEENKEYLEAVEKEDLVEIADALGDQLYIIYGTILKHGLQDKIEEVFKEIHRSNMSKLGADGRPIYREDGKILKGPAYTRPDIASIINK